MAATREELFKAFCAGFAVSGEGYNAEYRLSSDDGSRFEKEPRFVEKFRQYLKDEYPLHPDLES